MAYIRHRSQTVAIEVCLPSNFAVGFDFTFFRFRPSKSKRIGNVLPNRQNAAIRSMFFFLLYNAHCLLAQRVSPCSSAAKCKKSPQNTNCKLKTLQYCCALPNGARCVVASV